MFTTLLLCLSMAIHAFPVPVPGFVTSAIVPSSSYVSKPALFRAAPQITAATGRIRAGLTVVAKASSSNAALASGGASSFEFADVASRATILSKFANGRGANEYFQSTVRDLTLAQQEWASTEDLLDQTVFQLAREEAKLADIRKYSSDLELVAPEKELEMMQSISNLKATIELIKKDLVHKKSHFMEAKRSLEQVGRLSIVGEKEAARVVVHEDEATAQPARNPMSGAQREAAEKNLEKSFKLNPWNTPGQESADYFEESKRSGNPLDAFIRWIENIQKSKKDKSVDP